jgi:hemerythrin-like domain-containing protein
MKSTERLSREHQEILRALKILRSAAAAWHNDPLRTGTDCRALLDFLRTFADRCHHTKEEKVLFPKLMNAGIEMEGGPLGVMLMEHEQGRHLLREMEAALESRRPADFASYVDRYSQLLDGHIEKEDSILFGMAERLLTGVDDEAVMRGFDEIENEWSEDAHERFHQTLNSLAARYLSKPAKAS